MSLEADQIVDRRRLRRKLSFWRVIAVALAIIAVVGGALLVTRGRGALNVTGHSIARIQIDGLIRFNQQRAEALERLGRSNVSAVIVHINSPGGTVSGSEQLHKALLDLKAKKPMVVVVDGLAASGGYMAATSSDYIVSQESALVGSIGVIFQFPNVADLLKTVGVKIEEIKSSPLKAAPNGYEPTSPEARAAIESLVKDSYAWFRDMVKDRRHLDSAEIDKVADGRVFTGRQAIGLKLVDALGDEKTAIEWLAKTKHIDPKTPVRDYKLDSRLSDLPFLHVAALGTLDAIGLGSLARHIAEWGGVQTIERLNLDGLLALWHPQAAN